MARTESDHLSLAREIVAGRRSLELPELTELARALREEEPYRLRAPHVSIALSLAAPAVRDKVQTNLALATYKDPDLPVDTRLKTAEALLLDVLSRAAVLSPGEHQEVLGQLGGVYKQRWSVYGHKDHLEKSLYYYRTPVTPWESRPIWLHRARHRFRARPAGRRRPRCLRRAQRRLPGALRRGRAHSNRNRRDSTGTGACGRLARRPVVVRLHPRRGLSRPPQLRSGARVGRTGRREQTG